MTERLTPEDWIAAGFRALAKSGSAGLKAEKLARDLGTTKGSFYWHFKDVPAFHDAMLGLWQSKAVTDIIESLAPIDPPEDRLRALVRVASTPTSDHFGGAPIEPAIRAWSLQNERVAEGVARVDTARIKYLEELLVVCGQPASRAVLVYGAYVGLDDLGAKSHPDAPSALSDLIELVLSASD